MIRWLLFGSLLIGPLLGSGCTSVEVTPAAIVRLPAETVDRDGCLVRWRQAVAIANAFLDSRASRELPRGQIALDDQGMRFLADNGRLIPLRVRNTGFGSVVVQVADGSLAQERSDGFVVGTAGEWATESLLHHTFFYYPQSLAPERRPLEPDIMALLIVHELTHIVHRVGTVGTWPALRFYWRLLWGGFENTGHPAEEVPRRTNEDFQRWRQRTFAARTAEP